MAKEGFSQEANEKRSKLVEEFQRNESSFALKDQQDLLKSQGEGFPPDSEVNETIKNEAKNFEKISQDYKLPDGACVPDDVREAYFRMEAFQKKMKDNIEMWKSGDLSSLDDSMVELRKKFLTGFGSNNKDNNVMQSPWAKQLDNFMANQEGRQDIQPEVSLDLNQFKFDGNSFGG